MRTTSVVGGLVTLVAILSLMSLAYSHSRTVEQMYDDRMHRDIQTFTQELAQAGIPESQINAYRSVLLQINQNTLSYVGSEIGNVTRMFSSIGMIMVISGFVLFGRIREKDAGGSSS